jgi:hypothetical protein
MLVRLRCDAVGCCTVCEDGLDPRLVARLELDNGPGSKGREHCGYCVDLDIIWAWSSRYATAAVPKGSSMGVGMRLELGGPSSLPRSFGQGPATCATPRLP